MKFGPWISSTGILLARVVDTHLRVGLAGLDVRVRLKHIKYE